MQRDTVLALLAAYTPCDERDAQQCARIREFIQAHENCFERSLLKGHITGSSWLVNDSRDRVLLMHHRKLDRWMQLGGHADGDSDVLRVALKEAIEESGIDGIVALSPAIFDVDVHEIPARGEVPAHLHYDIRFALVAPAGAKFQINSEAKELTWVAFGDIEKFTSDESIIRMREKWLRR